MIKILFLMIFLHIIDDFHLQGSLKELKQKKWWLNQKGYKDIYKDDYKVALLIHSLSWSILISFPLWFFPLINQYALSVVIIVNSILHYYVDDMKCNKLEINLLTDQAIHFIQILLTWMVFALIYNS